MSGTWGKNIKYSIFGESHGEAIGIVIDGLPPGIKIDLDAVDFEMKRRAPGRTNLSTPRKEEDKIEIISGFFNGFTTGTPLCALIKNTNTKSTDYDELKDVMRPGHADYTGAIKYKGFGDYRGSGHFSGRITAPLVFAGAVAKQILKEKNILVGSHIYSIYNVYDDEFDKVSISQEKIIMLNNSVFPVINKEKEQEMKDIILKSKDESDSVGGIVECAIINLPAGIGSPFFDSVESVLSHLLFSIPAVKGVEFGAGFDLGSMKGSEANDKFYIDQDIVKTYTNNNGGISGGITSGMPLVFKCVIRPTSSIYKEQDTVNISTMENVKLTVEGRHDPCIVPRALPVVEAAAAIGILDFLI